MSKLQTPQHNGTRSFLRVAGLLVATVGLIFIIIGMASFFSAFGGGGLPRLFWCAFVGMPLFFVGSVMCIFGFMGAVARYTAAEQVPTLQPTRSMTWLRPHKAQLRPWHGP